MKKNIVFGLILVLALTLFSGCGKTEENKLYVFNWGDYMDMELIERFEEETGIDVVYEEFATNEDMYIKLKQADSNYDVIFPSDYMISKMIKEDMLEKIDFKNVPNYKYISDSFKNLEFDKENSYSVPYTWGTVGIVYNTDTIKDEIKSWDDLWNEKYKGEVLIVDSYRDALTPSFIRKGYSINTTNPEELKEAKEDLIAQKKALDTMYVGDNGKTMLLQGEASIFVTWIGEAQQIMGEADNLKYVIPEEGTNMFFDSMCIPKGAQNKEAAEKFINFMTDPEITAINYDYVAYPITNEEAIKLLPEEVRNDKSINPDKEVIEKCEVFVDLGEFVKEYDKAWTEIKVN